MFEKKCCNGGKKHNFQPRYEEVPNELLKKIGASEGDVRSLMYYKVYVGDRCTWCGKFLKKNESK